MRRLGTWLLAVLLGLQLVGAAPSVFAGEHLRSQVHPALWYYWPQRWVSFWVQDMRGQPLNIGEGAGITSEQLAEVTSQALIAWRQPCTDMEFYYEGITADRTSNMTADTVNNRNTIIFRYDDWDGTDCQEAIACTTVVTRRAAGEIIDADIDLNLQEHQFVLEPIAGSMAFDLQSVLTHEIGHMLGFDHTQPEHPEAVMWPYASWGEEATRRDLAVDDVNTMCETYPAGECTVVNDYGQHVCPAAEVTGTCETATAPTPRDGGWQLVLAGLGLFGALFLVSRRR